MGTTPADVITMAKSAGVKVVDLRFTDLFGMWRHFSIPVSAFTESVFEDGVGFDGSSIRGFQEIHESDMLLIPDPSTAFVDPFLEVPTLVLICDVYDPITRERYSRDPRYIAQKAEKFLLSTGIADKSYWGAEAEFFIFNDVRYAVSENFCYYFVDSREGIWNSGREERPNLAHKLRYREGYFPVPPSDTFQDIRSEIMLTLEKIGIQCEVHHHEVATGGQGEVDLHYDTLTQTADKLMILKYVVKMVARKYNMTATFMPKPLSGDNGSGMHTHQSLWRRNENLFYDERGYAQLSSIARYYIGGLLKHAPALLAFCAPTLNSYRRLVPGFEAPTGLVYSQRNRSACIRIPVYSQNPESKRIEFRPPDPSCNPYIAFAAMLMAGIDGILNRIDPGAPLDKNIYDLPPEEAKAVPTLPSSLEDAINCLEADNAFLMRGDVFTEDVIRVWIECKRKEVNSIKQFPHPYEFFLYYDV